MVAHSIHKELVKGFSEQEDLVSPGFEFLDEDTTLDLLDALPRIRRVENLSLSFPLVLHVLEMVSIITSRFKRGSANLIESDTLPLSGIKANEFKKSIPVLMIFRGTELENNPVILRDQSPFLGVFLCKLVEQNQEMPQDYPLHLLEEFGGLQSLTGDIEREVVSIDDNLDPAGPLGESLGTELGSNKNVFDHELDILLNQRIKALPVVVMAVKQINTDHKDRRLKTTNIFSGRKRRPLKEVPSASPEKWCQPIGFA